jgi:hypothetical protein
MKQDALWKSLTALLIALLAFSAAAWAETNCAAPQAGAQGTEPATGASERHDPTGTTTPTRVKQEVSESKGRKLVKQIVESPSLEGRYEAVLECEEETVQLDTSRVRVTRRAFGRDPDGRRKLLEVTEEEQRTLANGGQTITRTSSRADVNGQLRESRREVQEVRQVRPELRETTTTILLPGINGGITPAGRVQQTEVQKPGGVTEVRSTHQVPDADGRWTTSEVKQVTTVDDGKGQRAEDERLYTQDANRNLSLARRTVTKQSKAADGQERAVVETFSTNVVGVTIGGQPQLEQRSRTVRRVAPDGTQRSEQQVEQRSQAAPADGMRVTQVVVDISRPTDRGGTTVERKVQAPDPNRRLTTMTVSFEQQERKK